MLLIYKNIRYLTKNAAAFTYLSRHCSTISDGSVRVRFAPSPTGYLHLGGLRTALFNYLFSKKLNGKFILRIEDTDQTRLVEGAGEQLCKDLEWVGLVPDEGPYHYGGNYGPYIQSERLPIYRTEVKKLLENGRAYYCFCTERRLELLRKEALRTHQIPKYDNRCRHLTPGQIAEKLANKDVFCIRFKLNSSIQSFNDLVYGKISYDVTQNEGDPVIVKSDGFPTYHFASVVDDHLMKITHVLRGVEWQISTTKHLLMYKAFGWNPPEYAHLPLVTNPDGSKLSKRQNDIQINNYRENGIFPRALINYITLSGGGFDTKPSKKLQIFAMNDLVNTFNINKINEHSSRLNPDLLEQCNQLEIQQHINDPEKCEKLVEKVKEMIKQTYPKDIKNLDLSNEHIHNVLHWASHRLSSINQLVEGKLSFVWILPKLTKNNETLTNEITELLVDDLKNGNFTKLDLQTLLKKFSEKNNLSFSNLMKTLRNTLSGLSDGPSVAEMMEILGKEKTIQRIKKKK